MRRSVSLAAASLLSLVLAACGQKASEDAAVAAKGLGPAETVSQSAEHLRRGDLVAVIKAAVPADKYEQIKAEWANKTKSEPASEQDKKEFAEMMAKLTAADAEEKLYAELEPQLAKMETEMAAQLPLMVGMGRGFAVQAVTESTKLSQAQKDQATAFVDAFAKWVEGAQFFNRDKAKQAVAKMVATARGLEISTLDQVEAMDFEAMMGKAGQVWLGVRDVIAIYGLDVDAALASVKSEVLSEAGDKAKVKVSYTLFEQPLSFETEMVKRDDRWFGSEALAEIEKELAVEATADSDAAEPTDAADAEIAEQDADEQAAAEQTAN